MTAAEQAINSPLLESTMEGAKGVLLSIAGGSDLGLQEVYQASTMVEEKADPDANIIFGTIIDDNLGDEVRVTIIATGFDAQANLQDEYGKQEVTAQSGAQVQRGPAADNAARSQAQASQPQPARPERGSLFSEREKPRTQTSRSGGLFTSNERFHDAPEPRQPQHAAEPDDDLDVPDFMR